LRQAWDFSEFQWREETSAAVAHYEILIERYELALEEISKCNGGEGFMPELAKEALK
jgi:hypothetical protein